MQADSGISLCHTVASASETPIKDFVRLSTPQTRSFASSFILAVSTPPAENQKRAKYGSFCGPFCDHTHVTL